MPIMMDTPTFTLGYISMPIMIDTPTFTLGYIGMPIMMDPPTFTLAYISMPRCTIHITQVFSGIAIMLINNQLYMKYVVEL